LIFEAALFGGLASMDDITGLSREKMIDADSYLRTIIINANVCLCGHRWNKGIL